MTLLRRKKQQFLVAGETITLLLLNKKEYKLPLIIHQLWYLLSLGR